jgi:polyphosphate kinase 2
MQEWVKYNRLRVCVIFEGRDAAGKGGVIKRITDPLNPRICRVVALSTPTEKERGQWYFQRYVAELPSVGEIVLFDRSWYNRAGVERVMGFCTDEEYREFLRACPLFEEMLIKSGIILVKYWFSVNDEEQEVRFQAHAQPTRWKLSAMDVESRRHWVDYSRAKDAMFAETDTRICPWYVVNSDDKKKSRLNCIAHLLSKVPYRDLKPVEIELPPRQSDDYKRPKMSSQRFVPDLRIPGSAWRGSYCEKLRMSALWLSPLVAFAGATHTVYRMLGIDLAPFPASSIPSRVNLGAGD